MSIRTVVTRGYGNTTFNGTIALVVVHGYSLGVAVELPEARTAGGGAAGGRRTTGIRRTTRSFTYRGSGGIRIGGAAETYLTPLPREFDFASMGQLQLASRVEVSFYDHGPLLRTWRDEEELIVIGVL